MIQFEEIVDGVQSKNPWRRGSQAQAKLLLQVGIQWAGTMANAIQLWGIQWLQWGAGWAQRI